MMLFRDTVTLITVGITQNATTGQITDSETTKTIYANVKSVRQSEFYQALAANLKPEIMFVIRAEDYTAESRISYNNVKYEVVRTYTKNGELMELICKQIVLS